MILATLCYIEKDGKFLMLHRNKKKNDMHEGFWVGVGGKFERGESPDDCVKREVFEESGLRLVEPRLRAVLTFPNDIDGQDWYVFLYTADMFEGCLSIECNEGELVWIDKNKLFDLRMHEGDKLFLKHMMNYNGFFSAKLKITGEFEVIDHY